MNLNATLLGQMITFALFVWFTMRYVWPPITRALAERQSKIAEGLAAADRGVHQLEMAKNKAAEQLREAKLQAAEIIELANKRGTQLIEEAKDQAKVEGQRLLTVAQAEIAREVEAAKQQLRQQVADIVLRGAESILERHIDAAANEELIAKLVNDLGARQGGYAPAGGHISIASSHLVSEKGVAKA